MSRGPELRLVDIGTGEIHEHEDDDSCQLPSCAATRRDLTNARMVVESFHDLEARLADAETEIRQKRAIIRRLNAQLTEDLQSFNRVDLVNRVFVMWQTLCNHPRSMLDKDRADAVRKILMMARPDGTCYTETDARLAVLGAARSPFVTGSGRTQRRHDEIALIFRNAEKFEDFARRGAMWLRLHPEDAEWIKEPV